MKHTDKVNSWANSQYANKYKNCYVLTSYHQYKTKGKKY